jgi:plastocyanin
MQRLPELRRLALACSALALSLAAVSACGSSTPAMNTAQNAPAAGGGSAAQPQASATSQDPGMGGAGGGDCMNTTSVSIVEKAAMGQPDKYMFNPTKVNLKQGGYLTVINRSDEVHALESNPDAGIATSIVNKKELQVVQFPTVGTFTVQSADAKHRAVLSVTVSAANDPCAAPKSTLKLTEVVGMGGDKYSFSPKTLTVDEGDMVTVVNKTDESHSLVCTPNGRGTQNAKVFKGETQVITFAKAGTFNCSSLQHKDAKVKVVVKGM